MTIEHFNDDFNLQYIEVHFTLRTETENDKRNSIRNRSSLVFVAEREVGDFVMTMIIIEEEKERLPLIRCHPTPSSTININININIEMMIITIPVTLTTSWRDATRFSSTKFARAEQVSEVSCCLFLVSLIKSFSLSLCLSSRENDLFLLFFFFFFFFFYLIFIAFINISRGKEENRVLARRILHINYVRERSREKDVLLHTHTHAQTSSRKYRSTASANRHQLIEARSDRPTPSEREGNRRAQRHSWECEESISEQVNVANILWCWRWWFSS